MTGNADEWLENQVAYYRARAYEYDETSVGDVEEASRWFNELIEELGPRRELLEIACGTGLWTQHLVPWLSHVPPDRFAAFWQRLEAWLVPGGRVLFVDEGAPRASNETPTADSSAPLVVRRLHEVKYEILKVFSGPDELAHELASLGWSADIRLLDDGFLIGTAHHTGRH
jgi:hypothetical protein